MMHDDIVIPEMDHGTIEGIVSKMVIVDVDTAERRKYMMDEMAAFFSPIGGQFVRYTKIVDVSEVQFSLDIKMLEFRCWRPEYEHEVHLLDSVSFTAEDEDFYPEMSVDFDSRFMSLCPKEEERWTFAREGTMLYYASDERCGRGHEFLIAYGSSIMLPPPQASPIIRGGYSDWDPSDFD